MESSAEGMVFTSPSCPNGGWTVCRPRHTPLVMNPTPDVYFRRATLVHDFCGRTLHSRGCSWPGTKCRRPVC